MAFFSTTALGPGSPLFRGRAAELARLQRLCQEDVTRYGVIYGGRQNGKTSLLFQLQAAIQHPMRVCRVDFQQIQGAPPERVFAWLAEQIDMVLPLGAGGTPVTSAPQLKTRLNEALARPELTRLVLILDELGALPAASREALGNALRSFFHDRLVSPPLQKLLVIFSGGVELYTMAVHEVSSLHNVCEEIYLPDLPEPEAITLIADGLRAIGIEAKRCAELGHAVYARVSGHPYLTQRMGELLLSYHAAGATLREADVDRATQEIVAAAPPLLRRIRNDLRQHQLEDAACRLLRDAPRFSRMDDDMVRLELIGLAKPDGQRWAVRNPLLAAVFGESLGLTTSATTPNPSAQPEGKPDSPVTPEASSPNSEDAAALPADLDPIISVGYVVPPPNPRRSPLPAWVPELIKIPAGSFLMGSSDSDPLAGDREKPQHQLVLPDYWIGKTPVTNAQFRPFVEGDGYTNRAYWTAAGWQWRGQESMIKPAYWSDSKWNGADYPVVGISWFEAVAYCRWLSAQTGIEFRLPTEAEWEKAARGPDGWIWPWGSRWDAGRCNHDKGGSLSLIRFFTSRTTPVNQFPDGASPYGALDMAGNVWEWCATQWQKKYPYDLEDEWTATYLELDGRRTLRGGSWYNEQKYVRGAYRDYFGGNPRYRDYGLGLRVASHSPTRPES